PTTRCGAVGKLPPPASELPGASMTEVRNPLEVLCGQEQAEPRAGINPTLRIGKSGSFTSSQSTSPSLSLMARAAFLNFTNAIDFLTFSQAPINCADPEAFSKPSSSSSFLRFVL
ncbi:unnamed protein product, partial [Prunus brigantina]